MTDNTELESRYRRLLACYPASFRREHGQEMLSVLMAAPRRASGGRDLRSSRIS